MTSRGFVSPCWSPRSLFSCCRRTARRRRRDARPHRLAGRDARPLEGRYDEVDALAEKLDHRDPVVAAMKARRASPAAATPTPKRCCARSRRARRRAKRRSSSACCSRCSAAATPTAILRARRGAADASRDPLESRAPAARCARSAASTKPTPRSGTPRRRRPSDAAIQHGVGRALPRRRTRTAEALKLVPDGARRPTRAGRRRSSAPRARSSTTTRRRRSRLAKKALEINPSYVDAHVFLAEQAIDAGQARRSARSRCRRRWPSTRRASRRTRCWRRSPTSRTRPPSSRPRSPRCWPSRRATARCTASPAS